MFKMSCCPNVLLVSAVELEYDDRSKCHLDLENLCECIVKEKQLTVLFVKCFNEAF